MPTPTNTPTNLDVILNSVVQQLITTAGFISQTAFIGITPKAIVYPPSDQFCVVCPGKQTVNKGITPVSQHAKILYFNGLFSVTIYSRLALDEVPRSDAWLGDQTYGIFPRVASAISALQIFQPVNSDGVLLMAEPLRLESIDTFEREAKGIGWGAVELTFSLRWHLSSTPGSVIT